MYKREDLKGVQWTQERAGVGCRDMAGTLQPFVCAINLTSPGNMKYGLLFRISYGFTLKRRIIWMVESLTGLQSGYKILKRILSSALEASVSLY